MSEWRHPRSWLVPARLSVTIPKGYGWAAAPACPGRMQLPPRSLRKTLLPNGPDVELRAGEWGPEVAPLVRMLMIVPAVAAWASLIPGRGSLSMPEQVRLVTRRPVSWRFEEGDRLTLCAASSRGGEVLIAALMKNYDCDAAAPGTPEGTAAG